MSLRNRYSRFVRWILNPMRMAQILSVLVALPTLILLGLIRQRAATTQNILEQVDTIQTNLVEIRHIEADRLSTMREELVAAEAYAASVEAAFPKTGSPYAIYLRSFVIAPEIGAQLKAVRLVESTTEDSVIGPIHIFRHSLEAEAAPLVCLELLGRLESEGSQALTLNDILIDVENETCQFSVTTVGFVRSDVP